MNARVCLCIFEYACMLASGRIYIRNLGRAQDIFEWTRRAKLVLFFSYILLVNPHLQNSYKKNSMLLHGASIVANNDTSLKGSQRRLVTSVFFTRNMC